MPPAAGACRYGGGGRQPGSARHRARSPGQGPGRRPARGGRRQPGGPADLCRQPVERHDARATAVVCRSGSAPPRLAARSRAPGGADCVSRPAAGRRSGFGRGLPAGTQGPGAGPPSPVGEQPAGSRRAAGCGRSAGARSRRGGALQHRLRLRPIRRRRSRGTLVGAPAGAGAAAALQRQIAVQLAGEQHRPGAPRSQPADRPAGTGWPHHHPGGGLQGGGRGQRSAGHGAAAPAARSGAAAVDRDPHPQLDPAAAQQHCRAPRGPGTRQLPHAQQPARQWGGSGHPRQCRPDAGLAGRGGLRPRRRSPAGRWRCPDPGLADRPQQRSGEQPPAGPGPAEPRRLPALVSAPAGRRSPASRSRLGAARDGSGAGERHRRCSRLSDPGPAV